MTTMAFMPELRNFLENNQEIYTIRKYRYSTHMCLVAGLGGCERKWTGISPKTAADLIPYVEKSGFKNVDDWWRKLLEINHGYKGEYFLYHVKLVNPFKVPKFGVTGRSN